MKKSVIWSAIDSSLLNSTKIHESQIISSVLGFVNRLVQRISVLLKEIPLLKLFKLSKWKSAILFLFVIALTIAPESNIQLSNIDSANFNTNLLSQRQFGISLFYPINILLFFLVVMLINQLRAQKNKLNLLNFEILLIIFLIFSEISIITGTNIHASFVWLLKLILGLTVYLTFSRLQLNKEQFRLIFYGLAITIVFEGLLSIGQFLHRGPLGLPWIESLQKIDATKISVDINGNTFFRSVGTFSHPNILSTYIGIILPFCLILFSLSNGKFLRKILFSALVLGLIALVLTLSRWGIIVSLFSISLTFFLSFKFLKPLLAKIFHFKINKNFLKISFISCLIIFVLILSNPFISSRFLSFYPDERSTKTRLELISQALYVIAHNPFGIGPSTFPIYLANNDFTNSSVSQRYLSPVHNFYLLTASENGILSILIILSAIGTLTRYFMRRIKYIALDRRPWAIGTFVSFMTFFFSGLWEPRLFGDRIGILFFFMFGLLVNLLQYDHE